MIHKVYLQKEITFKHYKYFLFIPIRKVLNKADSPVHNILCYKMTKNIKILPTQIFQKIRRM